MVTTLHKNTLGFFFSKTLHLVQFMMLIICVLIVGHQNLAVSREQVLSHPLCLAQIKGSLVFVSWYNEQQDLVCCVGRSLPYVQQLVLENQIFLIENYSSSVQWSLLDLSSDLPYSDSSTSVPTTCPLARCIGFKVPFQTTVKIFWLPSLGSLYMCWTYSITGKLAFSSEHGSCIITFSRWLTIYYYQKQGLTWGLRQVC